MQNFERIHLFTVYFYLALDYLRCCYHNVLLWAVIINCWAILKWFVVIDSFELKPLRNHPCIGLILITLNALVSVHQALGKYTHQIKYRQILNI